MDFKLLTQLYREEINKNSTVYDEGPISLVVPINYVLSGRENELDHY